MTNPDAIAEIVERLERATAETDNSSIEDAIHALLPEPKLIIPRRYCSSIDSALTLVPERWRVTHAYGPPWHWCLARNNPTTFVEGKAPIPAIALCIAALRARQSP